MWEAPEACDQCTLIEGAGRRYCVFCGLSDNNTLLPKVAPVTAAKLLTVQLNKAITALAPIPFS